MSGRLSVILALAASLALAAPRAIAAPTPVTIPEGVAPPLPTPGQGLCIASAISTQPALDFGILNTGNYNGDLNTYMEAHAKDRVEGVQHTVTDLSNNVVIGNQTISYGDFTDSMVPGCLTGGCGFFVNDSSTSFASRLRGYLNVTADLAGKPIHIGFYADDAVSLTIFDKGGVPYSIVTRAPQLGLPTWRTTNTVAFGKPGLYPVEILYVQIAAYGALEMSSFGGAFTDFEIAQGQAGSLDLKKAGFTLYLPDAFFLTLSGDLPFADANKCEQCDRQFVNRAGNNGCEAGYYCNDAALCAPCDTALLCGPTCSPCGGATPFCVNVNAQYTCVGCRNDKDCKPGYHCDPMKHSCDQCETDLDCDKGQTCNDAHACVPCGTTDSCAGNSCNCCPKGSNGRQMQCAPLDKSGVPVCVECTADADCPGQRCDTINGHCVAQTRTNSTPDCCGDHCAKCPAEAPYCLPGPVGTACAECRSDADCKTGRFCLSGSCQPCIVDRHCGNRCTTCGGDTPFCLADRVADNATCVRCLNDSQCDGGHCNTQTHQCDSNCAMTCGAATFCDGAHCVECYADVHCPCGGTCDPNGKTCSSSCRGNLDCLGDEHCKWQDDGQSKTCALGPMPDLDNGCGHDDSSTTGTSASGLLVKTGALICTNLTSSCAARLGGRAPSGAAGVALLFIGMVLIVVRRRGGR